MKRNKGSFRDQDAHIFYDDGNVYRKVNSSGEKKCLDLLNSGIIKECIEQNFLIETSQELDESLLKKFNCKFLFRHKKIPYISYPYEWNFSQLKKAAIFHLEFLEFLLKNGFHLIDGSAYNIQFVGSKPIFIDLFSIERYQDNDHWLAHKQFCENFLNPLLLSSFKNIKFNHIFYGNLEGISNIEIKKILSLNKLLIPTVFLNITLPALFEEKQNKKGIQELEKSKIKKKFNIQTYLWLIKSLKNFIKKLKLPKNKIFWSQYDKEKTYNLDQYNQKKEIIKNFIIKNKPDILCDLGCNQGDFSYLALESGAKYAVGYDIDLNSLEYSFKNSEKKNNNFLPLYFDASNPFSNCGWFQSERSGFLERGQFNVVIALAFEHHLAIAKNIPLNQVVSWITALAPKGIIEFVPKSDQTIQIMLQNRKDIFNDYNQENFEKFLETKAKIINKEKINNSGRILYEFEKNN